MNIILFDQSDYSRDNCVRLSDHRFSHISKVIKPKTGDSLKVGLMNGQIGTGSVLEITSEFIDIIPQLETDPPAPSPITLLLAMPRPKVFKRVIKHVITLGIKKIYLINSYRVEKSYWHTPLLDEENLNKIFIDALEQACDTMIPEVHIRKLFKPFVEDELTDIIKGSCPLIAHPKTDNSIPDIQAEHITLAIGPEGGFIPYEIERLKECGFNEFKFGERILTVETAVPAIISKLT